MRLIKVIGDSMSPTLNGGDYVLTIRPRSLRPGFIYVVEHTDLGRIIKRLERVEDGRYYFAGDNPNSTPSAVIGPVSAPRIRERAVLKISNHGVRKLKPL
ncbi:MAG: peptidase S24 [Robiginitomaculum sp.]|nr:MAG: peptidase S24 [Robiginitomaculum sp.]